MLLREGSDPDIVLWDGPARFSQLASYVGVVFGRLEIDVEKCGRSYEVFEMGSDQLSFLRMHEAVAILANNDDWKFMSVFGAENLLNF